MTAPRAPGWPTVAIASVNRADILCQTLQHLASLSDRPEHVVLSLVDTGDAILSDLPPLPYSCEILTGPKGLCAQRNRVLDHLPSSGTLLFLDDDYLLADGALSALHHVVATTEGIAVATGDVLADGIKGPGIDVAEARAILAKASPAPETGCHDVFTAYGCNMALDLARVQASGQRFDERLPAYGWLEDYDFSRRMARAGRIVKIPAMRGVHLGTKSGRGSGSALGYSQIANPVYLMKKGSVPARKGLTLMTRNLLANLTWPFRSEPHLDRRGRARGNRRALVDALVGRLSPERATAED